MSTEEMGKGALLTILEIPKENRNRACKVVAVTRPFIPRSFGGAFLGVIVELSNDTGDYYSELTKNEETNEETPQCPDTIKNHMLALWTSIDSDLLKVGAEILIDTFGNIVSVQKIPNP